MEQKPLVNIITRTSNRPNGFEKCYNSVKNQTYPNIRHIVSYDDEKDYELYLHKYQNDIDIIFINKNHILQLQDIPNPRTGPKFIYNLYFNELFEEVKDGWILILDDDDSLASNTVIEEAINSATYTTDMLIWQMQYPNGMKLPTTMDFNKQPQLGRIGSPCIFVHSSIAKQIKWDGWKCGDFRYIHKVWKATERKIWFKKPMILLGSQGGGLGRRMDLPDAPENTATIEPQIKITTPKPDKKKYTLKVDPESVKKVNQVYKKKFFRPTPKNYKGKYEVFISIASYNRYSYLTKILDDLFSQETKHSFFVCVLDDCSTDHRYQNLAQAYHDKPFQYIRNKNNNGKQKYWETITKLFKTAEQYNCKLLVQMDDDFKICDNFIDNVIEQWRLKANVMTAAMKYHRDARDKDGRKVWGLNDWVDGGSAFSYKFLEQIYFSINKIPVTRWMIDKKLSSGVWEQVSKKINLLSMNIIKSDNSLVKHLDSDTSKMNPSARKVSNIKTQYFLNDIKNNS